MILTLYYLLVCPIEKTDKKKNKKNIVAIR